MKNSEVIDAMSLKNNFGDSNVSLVNVDNKLCISKVSNWGKNSICLDSQEQESLYKCLQLLLDK